MMPTIMHATMRHSKMTAAQLIRKFSSFCIEVTNSGRDQEDLKWPVPLPILFFLIG